MIPSRMVAPTLIESLPGTNALARKPATSPMMSRNSMKPIIFGGSFHSLDNGAEWARFTRLTDRQTLPDKSCRSDQYERTPAPNGAQGAPHPTPDHKGGPHGIIIAKGFPSSGRYRGCECGRAARDGRGRGRS